MSTYVLPVIYFCLYIKDEFFYRMRTETFEVDADHPWNVKLFHEKVIIFTMEESRIE